MAHIIIIGTIKTQLDQADEYHEQITTCLANGDYDESAQRKADAQAVLSQTISVLNNQKAALDTQVGNLETFLGI